jgi:hypothetical protein
VNEEALAHWGLLHQKKINLLFSFVPKSVDVSEEKLLSIKYAK